PFPSLGWLASTVGGSPALLASNPRPYGNRARWLGRQRELKGDWAEGSPSVSSLMTNDACAKRRQMVLKSPDSDTSHAQTLCSLSLCVLFLVALHCDNPGASAKARRRMSGSSRRGLCFRGRE